MEEKKHTVRMEERSSLHLTGILSVIGFREEEVELESSLGICQITGTGLHMEKLDLETGQVILTGKIISLYYPEDSAPEKGGLIRRLFS